MGVFLYFYFTQGGSPSVVGGNGLSLCLNGTKIENGGSLGLLDSGQEFTVENAEKYDVQIYAYCTQENDFALTVGEEPYTWGDFDGRNLTAGFDSVIRWFESSYPSHGYHILYKECASKYNIWFFVFSVAFFSPMIVG